MKLMLRRESLGESAMYKFELAAIGVLAAIAASLLVFLVSVANADENIAVPAGIVVGPPPEGMAPLPAEIVEPLMEASELATERFEDEE